MTQLSKHILFLFLMSSLLHINSVVAENQKLSLEINLDKNTFLLQEAIWLDITLKNISNDTVSIEQFGPPCHGLFYIELEDVNGSSMPYTGMINDMRWGPGWLANPNEQYYNCYDITALFGTDKSLLRQIFGVLPIHSQLLVLRDALVRQGNFVIQRQ